MILYSEYRLIERDLEISIAWKGAHLLLFFLAFLFGCFCTFCFHMISYMFDEQCVLFPKLLTLNKERNSMLYSFLPLEGTPADWPVDFITTQWVEKNVCVLPMFVPLMSGIFGLVWTTMFLMCSSSMSQHGLQRPWRLIIPVFLFSVIMSAVCIYTSFITDSGLKELCVKLGQATGSTGCSYTINVISLAYSRRIRGVYQATWLIVISAWLHTICWILSTVVALLRVALAVDFKLICVTATLEGNYEKLLQQNESQIRLTEPEFSSSTFANNANLADDDKNSLKTHLFFRGYETQSESTLISPATKSNRESLESIKSELTVHDHKKTLSFNKIDDIIKTVRSSDLDVTVPRRPVSDSTLDTKDVKSTTSITEVAKSTDLNTKVAKSADSNTKAAKSTDSITQRPTKSSLRIKANRSGKDSEDLHGSHHKVSIREPQLKSAAKKIDDANKKDNDEKKKDKDEERKDGDENKKDK